MARTVPLAMRITKDDKKALVELSKHFRRSQTNMVCVLLQDAYMQLRLQSAQSENKKTSQASAKN